MWNWHTVPRTAPAELPCGVLTDLPEELLAVLAELLRDVLAALLTDSVTEPTDTPVSCLALRRTGRLSLLCSLSP